MLQQEFEALTGKRVETEDYNSIIDPMYMSTDMTSKISAKTSSSISYWTRQLPMN